MTRVCRAFRPRRRSFAAAEWPCRLSIVTDPKALAYLNAEVERRRREKETELEKDGTYPSPASVCSDGE